MRDTRAARAWRAAQASCPFTSHRVRRDALEPATFWFVVMTRVLYRVRLTSDRRRQQSTRHTSDFRASRVTIPVTVWRPLHADGLGVQASALADSE